VSDAEPIEVGIYLPQVSFSWEDLRARAQLAEELGLESVWLYDHLYGPTLPDLPSLEAWTLATALLTSTRRLRVGHLVLCNQFRHPALLGKMASTLDVISGGRLDLGVGSGSVEIEHHEAGLPWGSLDERSDRLAETLEILTRMFEDGPTTFAGRHYRLTNLPNLPRPLQQPRPPIHIGGAGPRRTLPLVARYADVWNIPTYALDRVAEVVAAVDHACLDAGRDPETLVRSIEAVLVLAPNDDAVAAAMATALRRFGDIGYQMEAGGYIGTPETVAARIREHMALGFQRFVFFTWDRGKEETLRLLAEEVRPRCYLAG
jgi:alkanesulfonate monooxygenase SsuD/methylene tetrahydromethanopterin reductase-like flavin-dependent oxidoreductase (luciferase family)